MPEWSACALRDGRGIRAIAWRALPDPASGRRQRIVAGKVGLDRFHVVVAR
ncbi:hypothetical protein BSLA_03f0934 [Burkholderia stabilis]|nr:hypothetical protein BSLA_03f0934 [Burkholderia stabilis]